MRFSRAVRQLGVTEAGFSFLDQFRLLITEVCSTRLSLSLVLFFELVLFLWHHNFFLLNETALKLILFLLLVDW